MFRVRIIALAILVALLSYINIALNYCIRGPPRSPDLTPCDFFLGEYLKSKGYRFLLRDIDELKQRIENEANLLRENIALLDPMAGMRNQVFTIYH